MEGTSEDASVIAQYVAWLRSWGASEETVRARRVIAAGRLREWGIEGLTAANIQGWLGRPNLSRWSRATYHAGLSDFCSWLAATGRLPDNPMEDVRKPGRPRSLPRPLSELDVRRVLMAATGRQRHWLLLALNAGLRAHEIAKMRGEDVTESGIYVEGKGGVRASIPTHVDLWEIAQEYPPEGWWFPSSKVPGNHISASTVTNYTSQLFRSLGIEGSIHRCRHTYGTRLLRAGVNIRTVQQLMRHANLNTTAAYTAVDEDEMRAAINRLGNTG